MVNAEDMAGVCCCASMAGFFLLAVFVGIFFSMRSKRNFKNVLKAVAMETGCSYDGGGWFRSPMVSGTFRNRNIIVDVYTERGGHDDDSSTTYTRLQVSHAGTVPGEINVYPSTFLSSIGKKLGMQDIPIGNPEFDKVFIVKGRDEHMVKRILDFDVQKKLLSLKVQVHVLRNTVYVRIRGYVKDKNALMGILNLMADLAERVERAGV